MDKNNLSQILQKFQDGELNLEQVFELFGPQSKNEDDAVARIDLHRQSRTGIPEVIFAAGKSPDQVVEIFSKQKERGQLVLATRVDAEMYSVIQVLMPGAEYNPQAKLLYINPTNSQTKLPGIAVLTAGTSDIAVAEEAAITAELLGNQVERFFDVGVAGIHRLMDVLPKIQKANVLIVVAGMEGALPSVVGGLVKAPIIAVPTSIGYGASFHGLAALLGMLNSCSPGVSVVNIDNGFGAGCQASKINKLTDPDRSYV